ncbi:MAG: hypothetical protein LBI05_02220 [Planctomycetaceae bacterium]|nr:hypothetical protein [Planctomycetaceae bacterium]
MTLCAKSKGITFEELCNSVPPVPPDFKPLTARSENPLTSFRFEVADRQANQSRNRKIAQSYDCGSATARSITPNLMA